MENKRTLIIPCSGEGKRLKKYFFPKCLLPLKQRPILFQIIDYWKEYINQVVIVVNNNNKNIIKEYFAKYYPDKKLKIDFAFLYKSPGSYSSVKKGIEYAKNKKLILNWTDVCIKNKNKLIELLSLNEKNVVLTTDKVECRWKVVNNKFYHDKKMQLNKGGIFGIFIINDKESMFNKTLDENRKEEPEILEALDKNKFIEYKYENFYDIGDAKKYTSDLRKVGKDSGTRAFGSGNKMTIKKDIIIKYISDKKLRENEENWYKNANFLFIPKAISYNPLTLQRLNAIPAHDKLILNPNEEIEDLIIKQLFSIVKEIHLSKGIKESDFESSYDQYYAKTIKRLERVDFMFNSFNKDKIKINGKSYRNPLLILKENEEKIKSVFAKKFRFIHGDIQLCNTLIHKNNKLYVIDPRGYFGNSKLFGDPMYDFAKMYYGICGMYGEFCIGNNEFKINENGSFEIKELIDEETYLRRRNKFIKEFEKIDYVEQSMEAVDLLNVIIWLSVTDYTANDVLSCMYAYLKGTIMINEFFNGKK